MKTKPPESQRFLKWVEKKENGCWEWTGYRNRANYGIYLQDKAHRASYRIFVGPIVEDLWVLHKCDNPPCVNPDHLYLGTPKDNMDDCRERGRMRKEFGAARYCAKLDDSKVAQILFRLNNGESVIPIAQSYGVSRMAIYHIRNNTRWKHVPRLAL